MNQISEYIKQRLSLRKPLQEALEILVELSDILELKKEVDLNSELEKVKELYPTCTDFEREFPSICFSIATGVGKTRLMGACISYLYLEKGIRNFFVLAPNLTIYDKLIEDFGNSSNPKYVFNGIAEFVHNRPVIVTGENYNQIGSLFSETEVRINIFNVSKFNSENRGTNRQGQRQPPRLKRLSEYLGTSYWNYLSSMDDLVILMDEAHRYHADASRNAINELKPILGIELTATPFGEDDEQFRNVVYEYSLAQALTDGLYVKNPTIATRKDFDPQGRSVDEIEKIKLEDAISIHEDTKQELKLYSLNTGNRIVKPFILVVCRDTTHAKEISDLISSVDFYEGAYANKVLQIDSTTRNIDSVEQQFISLEHETNEIEIVIHVNMLKEGWDVTNLYTIVPLRAANASLLVEQTIGRGLRLPFNGERTGNDKVDKLTVVAHDNFNRVIEAAQDPNSILNKIKFVEIEANLLADRTEIVTSENKLNVEIQTEQEEINKIENPEHKQKCQNSMDAKKLLVNIIPSFNTNSQVKKVDDLMKPEVKKEIMTAVHNELNTGQVNLFAADILKETEQIYEKFVSEYKKNIIEIPRMVIVPGEVIAGFKDFDLNTDDFSYEQLKDEIIRISLKDQSVDVIEVRSGVYFGSPAKMLISELINYPEIDYDNNSDLLYKLVKQVIEELEKNIKEDENIGKIIFQWRKLIARKIYDQMMMNFQLKESDFEKSPVEPFTRIEKWNFTALTNSGFKDYRDESFPASQVPKFVYRGFQKACHFEYKFDSRSEQTYSFILENDKEVIKWLRPAPNQFRIYWKQNSKQYEPDFVVETDSRIYMVEIKAANEINDPDVQDKATAAKKYCKFATEYNLENGGKPWDYVMIPHNEIHKNISFARLSNQFLMK